MYKVNYTTRNGTELCTAKLSYDSAYAFMIKVAREQQHCIGGSFVEGVDKATVTSKLGSVYVYEIDYGCYD